MSHTIACAIEAVDMGVGSMAATHLASRSSPISSSRVSSTLDRDRAGLESNMEARACHQGTAAVGRCRTWRPQVVNSKYVVNVARKQTVRSQSPWCVGSK